MIFVFMAAEQKAIGMKKAYSGDVVVSPTDVRRSKYALQSLEKAGIDPTVETAKEGLLGETTVTRKSYDIGTGKPMIVTDKSTSPEVSSSYFNQSLKSGNGRISKIFITIIIYHHLPHSSRPVSPPNVKGDRR